MNKMFDGSDGSDTEINFKATNEYAKNYDKWRQKELLNTLKTKYKGDLNSDDESSSSDEDDSDIDLPDQVEMDFLKTLSSLKNKDPKIYDENVKFFDDTPIDPSVKKKKKEQPMFLKDYERTMLLEHGEKVFDEDDNQEMPDRGYTYVEEQDNIKKSLKSALDKVDDGDETYGGLFQARVKSKAEEEKEEANYKQWLMGQKENLKNAEDETTLKPLKDHWSDPNLEAGEKFLRDYILNNRFKESSDPNYVPTYDEIVHEDEAFSEDESNVDKQEEFEHKFNYRFEEPDQDFLKRYPRTVENSLRKTDDRRKTKRLELKERKAKEKQEKMEDIQKLNEIKRKEIEEKIKKLKEITGNTEVAFADNDVDDDFDPEAHDKRMRALFNEEFYTGAEGDEKPEFPELDDELGIERWDKLHKDEINKPDDNYDGPYAEDDDFNMDCDYDPSASTQDELIENSKGRRKRKRKSKFAKAVSEVKPIFDPNDKSYEEYLDEYYKLDCEDIVGGIPCRFKYRQVAANNFGLTIEEILTANDKELNRWSSIKKAMQYRPDHVEKYDQIAYTKKAQNEALKRKILPSLYAHEVQQPTPKNNKQRNEFTVTSTVVEEDVQPEECQEKETTIQNEKQPRKPKKAKTTKTESSPQNDVQENVTTTTVGDDTVKKSKKAKKKRNNTENNDDAQPNAKKVKLDDSLAEKNVDTPTQVEKGKNKKAKKQAAKDTEVFVVKSQQPKQKSLEKSTNNTPKSKNKNAKKTPNTNMKTTPNKNMKTTPNKNMKTTPNKNMKTTPNKHNKMANGKQQGKKNVFKGKNKNSKGSNSPACGLSDARLQAFGIKPKKFKNKLKYGNNSNT